MLRRAEELQPAPFGLDRRLQGCDKPGFSKACFTDHENSKALILTALMPTLKQYFQFFVAPNQRRLPRAQGLKAAPPAAGANNTPGMDRLFKAFGVLRRQFIILEQPAREPVGGAVDNNRIRLAAACRRAARLGVSPTTLCSCEAPEPIRSPTTTRPVAIPIRA